MSYGSAYIQAEPASRINARATRPRKDQVKRLVQYEKEFDVNLSRIETREKSMKDSMIAYSEKMRTISEARNNLYSGSTNHDPLFVRAKHIPKYPVRPPRKRRPMSFDELLGRDRDQSKQTAVKQRPHSDKQIPLKEITHARKRSDELHLPALSERLRKASPSVQVSLVSASDLYDIVDFSLRSKGTRQDSIDVYEMEKGSHFKSAEGFHSHRRNDKAFERFIADAVYDQFERCERRGSQYLSHLKASKNRSSLDNANIDRGSHEYTRIDSKEIRVPTAPNIEENNGTDEIPQIVNKKSLKLPLISLEPLRYRPTRVKRMKLQVPDLGIIPEDNVISHGTFSREIPPSKQTSVSPPPPRLSPRTLATDSSLDSIKEDENSRDCNEQENQKELPVNHEPKSSRRILMRDDGDVRIEVTQCPPKHETANNNQTKLKAQKKFKKLIYLRDMK